jgi:AraC-like DNA-binding protein
MSIREHWCFDGGAARLAAKTGGGLDEEIVLVAHPSTGLGLLVAVFDYDGTGQSVTLHDPMRNVVMVTCGSVFPVTVALDGQEVACGPHSNDRVTFVPAGTRMVLEHTRDSSMLCALMLPSGRLSAMWPDEAPFPAPFGLRDDAALAELVHTANRLVLRQSEKDNPAIEQATAQLAAGLARSCAKSDGPGNLRVALPPLKLRRVLAHIDANLERTITLRELADLAHLSPYHFARAFKQATGRSPCNHVRWRRITRCTALVARSQLKIAEISASTGFSSAAHFSSSFRRAAGISPAQFRRVVRPRLLGAACFGEHQPD